MCTHKNDRPVQRRIAIVGVGSGGSALADMLWKRDADKIYGEFTLTLVDPDRFENSNVTRHILRSGSFGKFKAEEMARLYDGTRFYNTKFGERSFLPSVRWNTPEWCVRWGHPKADRYFAEPPDLIACCADSDACCQLVNQYCVEREIPCVFAGVHGAAETAEIISYSPGTTPCYACYEREGPEPEPSQEKYTNPDYDGTKMPHQEGLWCDVLMAASIQFRAILSVFERKPNPLILASLRPPYGAEIISQKPGCAVCSEDFSRLRV
jgi:molybdopterin/thiamine biosynthesis adenylyltransferase